MSDSEEEMQSENSYNGSDVAEVMEQSERERLDEAIYTNYITVFDGFVEVYSCDSLKAMKRNWEIPQLPLNKFELTARNNKHQHNGHVYFNLQIQGPPIEKMKLKISKREAHFTSHLPTDSHNGESIERKIEGETEINWKFVKCNHHVHENTNRDLKVYKMFLKVQCSIPGYRPISFNTFGPSEAIEYFNNETFSDFQIKVGNKTFHVSKFILALNSPVFKLNFSSNLLEQQTNSMNITDFDAPVIEKLLRFLYDNAVKLDDNLEEVEKLLDAAEKYQIEKLKLCCEQILLNNINMENAVYYLIEIADRLQCKELRKACVIFLSNNYVDFAKTDQCKDLFSNYYTIALEISVAAALNSTH